MHTCVCVCKVLFSLSQTIIVAKTREFETIYYVIFLLVSFPNNLGFPRDSVGKESIHSAGYIGDREDPGDMHLTPGLGRFPGGKWQPTLFLPEKSHGQTSLASYSLWVPKKLLDRTE